MILQLKQIFDIDGEIKNLEYDIEPEQLQDTYIGQSLKTPIAINGKIENRAGIVTMNYSCKFTLDHVCDRCLKEFNREYVFDFEHTLIQATNTDSDEYIVCPDNTLDLSELAISDLLLQLPTNIRRREDCRGLCYVCGQDLNEGECNCS